MLILNTKFNQKPFSIRYKIFRQTDGHDLSPSTPSVLTLQKERMEATHLNAFVNTA